MIDLQLTDDTHDLVIQDYDLSLVGGAEYIAQNIKQRLQLFLGEWFLDQTQGVPWLQSILQKNPRQNTVEGALKAAIVGTDGVTRLESFSLEDAGDRRLRVVFRAATIYNESVSDSIEMSV